MHLSYLLGNVERPAVGVWVSPTATENLTKDRIVWLLKTLQQRKLLPTSKHSASSLLDGI